MDTVQPSTGGMSRGRWGRILGPVSVAALLGLVAGCGAARPAAHPGSTRGSPASLTALAFDGRQGWAMGPGIALRSRDAGRTWQVEPFKPVAPARIAFVTPRDGWVLMSPLSRGPTLFGTVDGGEHWRALTDAPLTTVQFLSPLDGYGITREGGLVRSRDGGRHWVPVPTPARIRSLAFTSVSTGWVGSAADWAIWRTETGGRSWEKVAVPVADLAGRVVRGQSAPARGWVAALTTAGRPKALWAVFDEVGWAGSPRPGILAGTADGKHWSVAFGGNDIEALQPAGPVVAATAQCPACGRFGTTSLWTGAGAGYRWRSTATPNTPEFDPEPGTLVETSPRRAWILTSRGIWTTDDRGRHWHEVYRIPG